MSGRTTNSAARCEAARPELNCWLSAAWRRRELLVLQGTSIGQVVHAGPEEGLDGSAEVEGDGLGGDGAGRGCGSASRGAGAWCFVRQSSRVAREDRQDAREDAAGGLNRGRRCFAWLSRHFSSHAC